MNKERRILNRLEYRERHKIESKVQNSHRQTRRDEKKKLEKKRKQTEYKRKYRATLHPQKKRRIRENDADQKRAESAKN